MTGNIPRATLGLALLAALACSLPSPLAPPTAFPCPEATPEPLWVTPIPASTDQDSIVVEVLIGNGEEVTVTTESGVFTAQGDFSTAHPAQVEVRLLPGVTHHLEVSARVATRTQGDCSYGGYTLHTTSDRDGGELVIQQTSGEAAGGPTPTLCPQATPEPLWVEPIPPTTDQYSVVVTVYIGNGDAVDVVTESGKFGAYGAFSSGIPALVQVTLQPGATHHLEVTARVRQATGFNGCPYGGYTLSTTRDRDGGELVIQQTSAP